MSRTDKADWKIVWIFCGMLAVCSLLLMRIYLLSMSSGLQQAAAEQSSYTLTVTTTRGRIYDRRMQPLTDTGAARPDSGAAHRTGSAGLR